DELFACWRYHAVFTDSPFETIQAEAQHRDHAVVEQIFADLTSGPLAHLPSGHTPANAAWLTCAAMPHNLTRAAGALAGGFHARARGATIRSDLIAVAAPRAHPQARRPKNKDKPQNQSAAKLLCPGTATNTAGRLALRVSVEDHAFPAVR